MDADAESAKVTSLLEGIKGNTKVVADGAMKPSTKLAEEKVVLAQAREVASTKHDDGKRFSGVTDSAFSPSSITKITQDKKPDANPFPEADANTEILKRIEEQIRRNGLIGNVSEEGFPLTKSHQTDENPSTKSIEVASKPAVAQSHDSQQQGAQLTRSQIEHLIIPLQKTDDYIKRAMEEFSASTREVAAAITSLRSSMSRDGESSTGGFAMSRQVLSELEKIRVGVQEEDRELAEIMTGQALTSTLPMPHLSNRSAVHERTDIIEDNDGAGTITLHPTEHPIKTEKKHPPQYAKAAGKTPAHIPVAPGGVPVVVSENKPESIVGTQHLQELEEKARYQTAYHNNDEDAAQEMVFEAAKKAGYTIVDALHGTTHKFYKFDMSKMNPESNMGAGIYLTNNPVDAEHNYAGEGPDLTNKIESEAEKILEQMESDPKAFKIRGKKKPTMEMAKEWARKELKLHGGEERIIKAAIKFDNPAILGGDKPTYLYMDQEYDEEYDDYSEPTGTFVDFAENIKNVASDYGFYDEGVKASASLYEFASGDDRIRLDDAIEQITKSEAFVDAYDYDNDKNLSSEIVRQALERTGFDGVIDKKVGSKFRRMNGMDSSTVHYIAFKPSAVKQTDPFTFEEDGNGNKTLIPLEQRFDPSKESLRYAKASGQTPAHIPVAPGGVPVVVSENKPESIVGTQHLQELEEKASPQGRRKSQPHFRTGGKIPYTEGGVSVTVAEQEPEWILREQDLQKLASKMGSNATEGEHHLLKEIQNTVAKISVITGKAEMGTATDAELDELENLVEVNTQMYRTLEKILSADKETRRQIGEAAKPADLFFNQGLDTKQINKRIMAEASSQLEAAGFVQHDFEKKTLEDSRDLASTVRSSKYGTSGNAEFVKYVTDNKNVLPGSLRDSLVKQIEPLESVVEIGKGNVGSMSDVDYAKHIKNVKELQEAKKKLEGFDALPEVEGKSLEVEWKGEVLKRKRVVGSSPVDVLKGASSTLSSSLERVFATLGGDLAKNIKESIDSEVGKAETARIGGIPLDADSMASGFIGKNDSNRIAELSRQMKVRDLTTAEEDEYVNLNSVKAQAEATRKVSADFDDDEKASLSEKARQSALAHKNANPTATTDELSRVAANKYASEAATLYDAKNAAAGLTMVGNVITPAIADSDAASRKTLTTAKAGRVMKGLKLQGTYEEQKQQELLANDQEANQLLEFQKMGGVLSTDQRSRVQELKLKNNTTVGRIKFHQGLGKDDKEKVDEARRAAALVPGADADAINNAGEAKLAELHAARVPAGVAGKMKTDAEAGAEAAAHDDIYSRMSRKQRKAVDDAVATGTTRKQAIEASGYQDADGKDVNTIVGEKKTAAANNVDATVTALRDIDGLVKREDELTKASEKSEKALNEQKGTAITKSAVLKVLSGEAKNLSEAEEQLAYEAKNGIKNTTDYGNAMRWLADITEKGAANNKAFAHGLGLGNGVMAQGVGFAVQLGNAMEKTGSKMMEIAKFNVAKSTAGAHVDLSGSTRSINQIRSELNLTRDQAGSMFDIVREGAYSGVTSVDKLVDAAKRLRDTFGGFDEKRLKDYFDLLKRMPSLEKTFAGKDEGRKSQAMYALAMTGQGEKFMELGFANPFGGGIGGRTMRGANVINAQQSMKSVAQRAEETIVSNLPVGIVKLAEISKASQASLAVLKTIVGLIGAGQAASLASGRTGRMGGGGLFAPGTQGKGMFGLPKLSRFAKGAGAAALAGFAVDMATDWYSSKEQEKASEYIGRGGPDNYKRAKGHLAKSRNAEMIGGGTIAAIGLVAAGVALSATGVGAVPGALMVAGGLGAAGYGGSKMYSAYKRGTRIESDSEDSLTKKEIAAQNEKDPLRKQVMLAEVSGDKNKRDFLRTIDMITKGYSDDILKAAAGKAERGTMGFETIKNIGGSGANFFEAIRMSSESVADKLGVLGEVSDKARAEIDGMTLTSGQREMALMHLRNQEMKILNSLVGDLQNFQKAIIESIPSMTRAATGNKLIASQMFSGGAQAGRTQGNLFAMLGSTMSGIEGNDSLREAISFGAKNISTTGQFGAGRLQKDMSQIPEDYKTLGWKDDPKRLGIKKTPTKMVSLTKEQWDTVSAKGADVAAAFGLQGFTTQKDGQHVPAMTLDSFRELNAKHKLGLKESGVFEGEMYNSIQMDPKETERVRAKAALEKERYKSDMDAKAETVQKNVKAADALEVVGSLVAEKDLSSKEKEQMAEAKKTYKASTGIDLDKAIEERWSKRSGSDVYLDYSEIRKKEIESQKGKVATNLENNKSVYNTVAAKYGAADRLSRAGAAPEAGDATGDIVNLARKLETGAYENYTKTIGERFEEFNKALAQPLSTEISAKAQLKESAAKVSFAGVGANQGQATEAVGEFMTSSIGEKVASSKAFGMRAQAAKSATARFDAESARLMGDYEKTGNEITLNQANFMKSLANNEREIAAEFSAQQAKLFSDSYDAIKLMTEALEKVNETQPMKKASSLFRMASNLENMSLYAPDTIGTAEKSKEAIFEAADVTYNQKMAVIKATANKAAENIEKGANTATARGELSDTLKGTKDSGLDEKGKAQATAAIEAMFSNEGIDQTQADFLKKVVEKGQNGLNDAEKKQLAAITDTTQDAHLATPEGKREAMNQARREEHTQATGAESERYTSRNKGVQTELEARNRAISSRKVAIESQMGLASETGASYGSILKMQGEVLALTKQEIEAKKKAVVDQKLSGEKLSQQQLEIYNMTIEYERKKMGYQRSAFDNLMGSAFGSLKSGAMAVKGMTSMAGNIGILATRGVGARSKLFLTPDEQNKLGGTSHTARVMGAQMGSGATSVEGSFENATNATPGGMERGQDNIFSGSKGSGQLFGPVNPPQGTGAGKLAGSTPMGIRQDSAKAKEGRAVLSAQNRTGITHGTGTDRNIVDGSQGIPGKGNVGATKLDVGGTIKLEVAVNQQYFENQVVNIMVRALEGNHLVFQALDSKTVTKKG